MKRLLFVIAGLSLLFSLNAQVIQKKNFELTGGLGITQFFGDIGGYSSGENLLGLKDMTLSQTSFNISAGMRYRVIHKLAVRLNIDYGCFRAADTKGSNVSRAFECKNRFVESSLLGEFYFLNRGNMVPYSSTKGNDNRFRSFLKALDPYLFAGVGALSFNNSSNNMFDSVSPESIGFTAVLPAGAGLNILLTQKFEMGLELGGRYTFSDLLDGYTSVYSKHNDVYYFMNLTAGFKF